MVLRAAAQLGPVQAQAALLVHLAVGRPGLVVVRAHLHNIDTRSLYSAWAYCVQPELDLHYITNVTMVTTTTSIYLAAGVCLVWALLDAVADSVSVFVDLTHAASAAVHPQAGICYRNRSESNYSVSYKYRSGAPVDRGLRTPPPTVQHVDFIVAADALARGRFVHDLVDT